MSKICANCNTPNVDVATFCAECGKRFDERVQPRSPPLALDPVPNPGYHPPAPPRDDVARLKEENNKLKAENEDLKQKMQAKVLFDPRDAGEMDCEKMEQEVNKASVARDYQKAARLESELNKLKEVRQDVLKFQSEFAEALDRRDFAIVAEKAQAIHRIVMKSKGAPAPSAPGPIASDQTVDMEAVLAELRSLMQTVYIPGAKDLKAVYDGVKKKKHEMETVEREVEEARSNRTFDIAGQKQRVLDTCFERFTQLLEQFLQPTSAMSIGAVTASGDAVAATRTGGVGVTIASEPAVSATTTVSLEATRATTTLEGGGRGGRGVPQNKCMMPGCSRPTFENQPDWYCGNNHVAMAKFKPGAVVQAKYKDGKWYPAKIERLNGSNNMITVNWTDSGKKDNREKKHTPAEKEVQEAKAPEAEDLSP